jgi:hypothetical protein
LSSGVRPGSTRTSANGGSRAGNGLTKLFVRASIPCCPEKKISASSYILKLGSLSYNKIDRFKNCDQKLSLILKYVKGCKHPECREFFFFGCLGLVADLERT